MAQVPRPSMILPLTTYFHAPWPQLCSITLTSRLFFRHLKLLAISRFYINVFCPSVLPSGTLCGELFQVLQGYTQIPPLYPDSHLVHLYHLILTVTIVLITIWHIFWLIDCFSYVLPILPPGYRLHIGRDFTCLFHSQICVQNNAWYRDCSREKLN